MEEVDITFFPATSAASQILPVVKKNRCQDGFTNGREQVHALATRDETTKLILTMRKVTHFRKFDVEFII